MLFTGSCPIRGGVLKKGETVKGLYSVQVMSFLTKFVTTTVTGANKSLLSVAFHCNKTCSSHLRICRPDR